MKRSVRTVFVMFAALMIALGGAAAAGAGEDTRVDKLLELLTHKGVITADEAVELKTAVDAPEPAARVSPGLQAAPAVKINGYLKLQAQFTENDATQNPDTLRLRQMRVTFSGSPAPNYKWKIGLAAERTDPILKDASISYDYSQNLNISAGQIALPISRESMQSSSKLDLMERAQVLDQFRAPLGLDIGIMLTLKPIDDWQVELGAYNGNGKNTQDSNDQKVWAGRVSGTYESGALILQPEIAFLTGPTENKGAPPFEKGLAATAGFAPYDKTQRQMGLVAMYRAYTFKYEYMEGRYRPRDTAVGSAVIADGMYAQLGRQIAPGIAAFIRVEDFDENTATLTAGDVNWTTLGLKYMYRNNLAYKLNYTWKKEAVNPVDNDRLGMEMLVEY